MNLNLKTALSHQTLQSVSYIAFSKIVLVGEVRIRRWSTVWYNCVIRGDINRVDIYNFTSIGDNTVIHTAAAIPTGMPAKVYIGRNCTIGRGCTLYSCHIEDDVVIGDKCVILEGARIEKGA